ncbi:RT18B-like protein [Mya arenaria]|uniref:RT18B-like protein n=1 Tax=Mya arenaria TaxID=6604 RepID=A0ABY7GJX8_MYAAR|nr:RT18B-like protein [Mya arenaria]
MLNGVISRAELCLSCHLLDAEKEKKARPPLTDREFEGKPGYLVVKAPLEKCIEYLKTYKAVYGDDPVWKNYRRNVVGTYAIRLRTTCIRKGIISTGSACPICRDDYLKFDYRVRVHIDEKKDIRMTALHNI